MHLIRRRIVLGKHPSLADLAHFSTMKTVPLLLAAFTLSSVAIAQENRRPNVIVIVADDLGFADVGFNGCKGIPTPHIDSLAQRGVRCVNGCVLHPFCKNPRPKTRSLGLICSHLRLL